MSQAAVKTQVTLRDYWHIVWVRKWIVVAVVVVCTATAFVLSYSQTKTYTATAWLMYEPPTNIANPLSTSSSTDVNSLALELQGVVNTLASEPVVTDARKLLGVPGRGEGDFSVEGSILPPDASSGASVSDTVGIRGESTDPSLAAAVANAYAQAVIDVRKEAEQRRLRAAQEAVRAQMDRFQTQESRLSTDYLLLAQRLNDLQVAEATVTGSFKVIRDATVPTSASAPKPLQAVALGFCIGLFAGVALAFILAQFDTRVRSNKEAGEILDLPVIGRLPLMTKETVRAGAIPVASEPTGAYAEAVRMLRSNLGWSSVASEWKSLLVTSASQGEGKSMTLCNVAVAMALTGKKVILVDADLRAPRVHTYFGLDNTVGLTSILMKPAPAQSVMKRVPVDGQAGRHPSVRTTATKVYDDFALSSLQVLTSGPLPPHPGEVAGSRRLADVIQELTSSNVDCVLVDGPPLLGVGDTTDLARLVDGLLIVVNLKHSKRPVLEDCRDALAGLPCRKLGVVVVEHQRESTAYYGYKPTPG